MSHCALPAEGTTAATCMLDSDARTMHYLRNELVPIIRPSSNLISGQVLQTNISHWTKLMLTLPLMDMSQLDMLRLSKGSMHSASWKGSHQWCTLSVVTSRKGCGLFLLSSAATEVFFTVRVLMKPH